MPCSPRGILRGLEGCWLGLGLAGAPLLALLVLGTATFLVLRREREQQALLRLSTTVAG